MRRAERSETKGRLRVLRPIVPLLVVTLIFALALPSASAQRDSDLQRIRTDIARMRARLAEVRAQTQSAERELERVDLELAIHTNELELATAAEAAVAAAQAITEREIATLMPRIEQQKKDLQRRLVALYRLGGLSYVRMFLELENNRSPIEAMSMLSYLVTRDARLVTRFQETQQQLAMRREQMGTQRKELLQTRLLVDARREAVIAARVEKQTMLERLRREESGTALELAALEEKARRLQRLVDTLSARPSSMPPVTDIRSVQGALAWPVEGKVFESFGRQRNPKFATYTVNNGLKIEASPGTPVRAVFQGTVLFAQWFKGYGNLIILDHGNRVFTLYGNLKQSSVAAGDRIATGQTIAGVGESEETATGHLYFEVRHDNRPEDPQRWLR